MYEQDSSLTSLSDFITNDPRELHGPNRARHDAKRAVFHLLATSNDPAILVAKEWRVVKGDYMFEYIKVYEDVAIKSGCCVIAVSRELEGGVEHLLLFARHSGLTESELLSFVATRPSQPVGAHSRWA